jgi:hypothetical protein
MKALNALLCLAMATLAQSTSLCGIEFPIQPDATWATLKPEHCFITDCAPNFTKCLTYVQDGLAKGENWTCLICKSQKGSMNKVDDAVNRPTTAAETRSPPVASLKTSSTCDGLFMLHDKRGFFVVDADTKTAGYFTTETQPFDAANSVTAVSPAKMSTAVAETPLVGKPTGIMAAIKDVTIGSLFIGLGLFTCDLFFQRVGVKMSISGMFSHSSTAESAVTGLLGMIMFGSSTAAFSRFNSALKAVGI